MNKIILKYYLAFIFFSLFLTIGTIASDDKEGRIGKSRISNHNKFTNKTKIRNDRLRKSGNEPDLPGVPDPGGDDGWPIPIADGFEFIIIGGIIYLIQKRRKRKLHTE